jgi:tripartite ATP-independent transporter DctP family solute receptor
MIISGCAYAADEVFTMKIGTTDSEAHPTTRALEDAFKKYVEAESGGKIKVELYINSQLGATRELVEGLQMGTIQGCSATSAAMSGFEKKLMVIDLPFLFPTKEIGFKALDGDMGEILKGLLEKQGIVVLAFEDNGIRQTTNNRKPIYTPDDLGGLKIRTMESPMQMSTFRLLGANPTPISYAELYTSLQQKTVDAQENSPVVIYDTKLQEVQKYLSFTSHQFSTEMLLASSAFMNSLPDDLKKIVVEGGRRFAKMQREIFQKEEDSLVATLEGEGMEVNYLTREQLQLFIDKTRPVYDEYKDEIGEELMNLAYKYQNM